jgi:hypothetical protein
LSNILLVHFFLVNHTGVAVCANQLAAVDMHVIIRDLLEEDNVAPLALYDADVRGEWFMSYTLLMLKLGLC